MMDIFIYATLSALGLLYFSYKMLGLHRLIKWEKKLDILVTFGLPVLFYGTFSGMVSAVLTGIIFSGGLHLLSKLNHL